MPDATTISEAPMTPAEAFDHVEKIYARFVRPLEKLRDVLHTAKTVASYGEAAKAQLERELTPLRAEKAALADELAAKRRACAEECAAALAAVSEPVGRKLAELAGLTAEADRERGKLAELHAEETRLVERLRTLAAAVAAAEAIR